MGIFSRVRSYSQSGIGLLIVFLTISSCAASLARAADSVPGNAVEDGIGGNGGAGAAQSASAKEEHVDLLTGAATFSIPITVPTGKDGMQPNLTLQYSSDAPGKTWVSRGWHIELGEIVRQGKNGAVPKFDATDTFVLSFAGGFSE